MSKYCPDCGKQSPSALAKFCFSCGSSLDFLSAQKKVVAPPVELDAEGSDVFTVPRLSEIKIEVGDENEEGVASFANSFTIGADGNAFAKKFKPRLQ